MLPQDALPSHRNMGTITLPVHVSLLPPSTDVDLGASCSHEPPSYKRNRNDSFSEDSSGEVPGGVRGRCCTTADTPWVGRRCCCCQPVSPSTPCARPGPWLQAPADVHTAAWSSDAVQHEHMPVCRQAQSATARGRQGAHIQPLQHSRAPPVAGGSATDWLHPAFRLPQDGHYTYQIGENLSSRCECKSV